MWLLDISVICKDTSSRIYWGSPLCCSKYSLSPRLHVGPQHLYAWDQHSLAFSYTYLYEVNGRHSTPFWHHQGRWMIPLVSCEFRVYDPHGHVLVSCVWSGSSFDVNVEACIELGRGLWFYVCVHIVSLAFPLRITPIEVNDNLKKIQNYPLPSECRPQAMECNLDRNINANECARAHWNVLFQF